MITMIIITGAVEGSMPFISGWIIDNVVETGNLDMLKIAGGIYTAVIIAQITTVYWFIFHAGKVESGMAYNIRKRGFAKLQRLSLSFYDKNSAGTTLSKLTSDVGRVCGTITWGIIDYTWGTVMMLTMSILMFIRSWQLALVTLAVMPILFGGGFLFQKIIINKYRAVRKINGIITGAYNEGIMGARTVKTLSQEERSHSEFKDKTHDMKQKAIKAGVIGGIFFPFVGFMASVGTALALWAGGVSVANEVITYGMFATFIFSSMQFFYPVYQMSQTFANLQYARAAGERIIDLMDTEEEIVDCTESDIPRKIEGNIEFKNVSFEYVKGERVLKNFSINIKKGESIALVGHTGSGKSTIVNLACRFYEPTEGTILIDGKDYKEISQRDLHSSLGYVLQSPYLFNDTIMENIRFGRLDATEEEIIQACKEINAHEFIMNLEFGYQTKAGESGKLLSTGQKQLISMARAVLADPSIFVLDEATSSVDGESEVKIQKATDRLLEGRTSFIIAHRLSTVVHADRILVVDKGVVIEEGSHNELISLEGHYHKLYTNQFFEEREAELLKEK
ncbi:ABC transporter ATP-binding protein [Thiospirochaeta perfilievii]|uniref:ABC transporter ATP-binding protein n=2 Tax=Thiospirochaeta perfilievii TaxID=252967 RepID=A0A5C1QH10_9SPIO|nr:ABC transporter ATP-binding protein [Thiospirochaeta perfilievii]